MKNSFKIAFKYFKYVAIFFLTSYAIYIAYDDYTFIKSISSISDFGVALRLELSWLLAYFLGFSFYYWLTAFTVILIYHKRYKSIKNDRGEKKAIR